MMTQDIPAAEHRRIIGVTARKSGQYAAVERVAVKFHLSPPDHVGVRQSSAARPGRL